MGYRIDEFAPGEIYHVYTRGVEQRTIFLDKADRHRFLMLLLHCLPQGVIPSYSVAARLQQQPSLSVPGTGLVDLLCYCLMGNHVHLLLQENCEGGTTLYIKRLLTSYASYFNRKYDRSGSLFLHPFKAVLVNDDEQLLHVSRYIHLNPYVAHISDSVVNSPWSSLKEYLPHKTNEPHCHIALLQSLMEPKAYRDFITNEADYARSLADIQHVLVDFEV